MSHFTVLVAGDPDLQLDPFYEQPEHPDNRLQWENRTEMVEKEWTSGKNQYGEIALGDYEDLAVYAQEYHGYDFREDIQQFGFWNNPNAKWDWYSVGGRWNGLLKLKKGGTTNQCLAEEIDWNAMEAKQRTRKENEWDVFHKHWDKNIWADLHPTPSELETYTDWQKRNPQLNDIIPSIAHYVFANNAFKEMDWLTWGLNDVRRLVNETREEYSRAKALTYAFIDTEGEWYQKGEMGWWGMSDEEKGTDNFDKAFWEMVNGLHPSVLVSVVDCHI